MSKNIDDVIEEVLPDDAFNDPAEDCQLRKDRDSLKQAIQDKKLCLPLSEKAVFDLLDQWSNLGLKDLAKLVYESQFKAIKEQGL